MLKKTKFGIYLKHLFVMSTVNKIRAVLTGVGFFVGISIFSVGIIIIDSFYYKQLEVVDEISKNSIAISADEQNEKLQNDLLQLKEGESSTDLMVKESISIFSTKIGESRYLNVMAELHGVSDLYKGVPLMSTERNIYIVSKPILLEGRFLTMADVQERNHVVVIDEITAQLLYPNESAIGKTIDLNVGINGSKTESEESNEKQNYSLEIIGIMKSNSIANDRLTILKKQMNESDENLFYNAPIYCPITVIYDTYKINETKEYLIYFFKDEQVYDEAVSWIESYIEVKSKVGIECEYITQQNQKEMIEQELKYTKTILNMITLLLCIISGISIMSITFFSIKERVPEIGVRKAFGATNIDIVFQFIFEMVIISCFASILAVAFSVIFSKAISLYLYNKMYIIFNIKIQSQHLILPILLGILEAVLCSIIPSMYGARIKVIDALKFE